MSKVGDVLPRKATRLSYSLINLFNIKREVIWYAVDLRRTQFDDLSQCREEIMHWTSNYLTKKQTMICELIFSSEIRNHAEITLSSHQVRLSSSEVIFV